MFIIKILEFITEFFAHLTLRKVVGGILLLLGLYFIGKADFTSSINELSPFNGIIGILIGGIGVVIIIYDTAKTKQYSDVETLEKAYRHQEKQQGVTAWHMEDRKKDKS